MTELKRIDPAATAKLWAKHGIKPTSEKYIRISNGELCGCLLTVLAIERSGFEAFNEARYRGNIGPAMHKLAGMDRLYKCGLICGFDANHMFLKTENRERCLNGFADGHAVRRILESEGRL